MRWPAPCSPFFWRQGRKVEDEQFRPTTLQGLAYEFFRFL